MRDNREIYSTVEFDSWARAVHLNGAEMHVIESFLDRDARTFEAGSGGGRILLAMKEMGFAHLSGCDFVPAFVDEAKRKDVGSTIDFRVGDVTSLDYADAAFGQIIYLQQILSFIDPPEARSKAVREAWRILEPGGTAVFSFLSIESRSRSLGYAPLLLYLRLLRLLPGRRRPMQLLPWLRLGGKFNSSALLDRGPYNYWFKAEEAGRLLEEGGFTIRAAGWASETARGVMHDSCAELAKSKPGGVIMLVCTK